MKQAMVLAAVVCLAVGAYAQDEPYTNKQEVVSQPAKIELANDATIILAGPQITWTYYVRALDAAGNPVVLVKDGETLDAARIIITLAEWKAVLTSMGLDATQYALDLQRSLLKAAKAKLTE